MGNRRSDEWVRQAIARTLSRARPGSSVDISWSAGDLSAQTVRWAAALIRGTALLAFVPGGVPRFAEPGVTVMGRRSCRIGQWTLLERRTVLRSYGGEGIVLGERVVIGSGSILEVTSGLFRNAGRIRIGDRSSLGDYCYIGGAGGVILGNNVLCGQYVSFHSENHRFDDVKLPIREQGVTHQGIHVHDDCWLGAGVKVLDGVVIGRGAVVGAGSVVTTSLEPWSIAAGAPARVIGSRVERAERPAEGKIPPLS